MTSCRAVPATIKMFGGAGNDHFDGGDGYDTVSYAEQRAEPSAGSSATKATIPSPTSRR